ncbi:PREDICTED: uncharacterized protein LOC105555897, partial [Vollenhovia emeryi]|uniref:uncharacterized protein LOC105555897 n=1 Tax=Vollenhovia emeryi TaxID=411798 RepID=UPI0005F51D13
MPNLGGPSGRTRKLYANIVNSIALYGAPVWAQALTSNRKAISVLRKAQRRMAVRATRAYRTVSHAAATLMARMPPVELLANTHAEMYARVAELRARGVLVTAKERRLISLQLKTDVREEWRAWLERPDCAGQRTVRAILPHFNEWLDRPWPRASFRTTQ